MHFASDLAAGISQKNTRRRGLRGLALSAWIGLLPIAFWATAQQATAQQASLPQTSARYLINMHGLHVLTAAVSYRLGNNAYSGLAQVWTSGLLGLFVQTDMRMQGTGRFLPDGMAEPAEYDSAGTYNHEQSHLHMIYQGGVPRITVQEPPLDNREEVTPAERAGAQDVVALLVGLVHQLQTSHRCQEAPQKFFDGLRLSTLTMRNTGAERPPSAHPKHGERKPGPVILLCSRSRGSRQTASSANSGSRNWDGSGLRTFPILACLLSG
ncbi:DUF3108 domain-containing protein [Acetobacter okinawensis]|uniref:DUF3108 domain-containing protein n=1 Tax=Acetobacter okinawensis TaxID=1076594 RepID=UPI000684B55A|nr:DUF3108 domain-containing protein [Acetobacter okinawensis]